MILEVHCKNIFLICFSSSYLCGLMVANEVFEVNKIKTNERILGFLKN